MSNVTCCADAPQSLISVEAAQKLIEDSCRELGTERVPWKDALGRILREDVRATGPLPPFDQSAMDGFALRHDDTTQATVDTPVRLAVVGEVAAGDAPAEIPMPGACLRIMTGGSVPPGTDTVVMKEHVTENDDTIEVSKPVLHDRNIRHAGEEVAEGTVVLSCGTRLDPPHTATLATLGVAQPMVARKPRVSILVTGKELVDPTEAPKPGQIRNSNQTLLIDLVTSAGGSVVRATALPDEPDTLAEAFAKALEDSDTVFISGGVSVGRYDHTRDVLHGLGVNEVFWRVAQKPGKPLYFGKHRGTLVFGMPGNPVSVWNCFVRFGRPALLQQMGHAVPWPKMITARTTTELKKRKGLTTFLRGITSIADGVVGFSATHQQGSHMLTSVARDVALAVVPADVERVAAGSLVDVVLPDQWLK